MDTQIYHTYPVFEKNQVLTHLQLNQMVSYLEEQERLTRTGLIGIGIVCGLDLKFVPETESELEKDTLLIGEGVGITSEGYLIELCDCSVTKFRAYNTDAYVKYAPFQDPETDSQDIELWELLSDDFEEEDSEVEVHQLQESDLENRSVILFLEIFDKDLKSCLSNGCDEIGVERKLNLRKLLISKSDLEKVLERTGNEGIGHYTKRFELRDFSLKKGLFAPPVEDYDSITSIGQVYADLLFAEEDNPVETILSLWSDAYRAFVPVLNSLYEENPFEDAGEKRADWDGLFNDEERDYFGIQYYYDFIKDLILAYREFRETSFELLTMCCPDRGLFPQHLILGEITDNCIPSQYRQPFIQSPVYSSQDYLLEKTRLLFVRAVMMMDTFDTGVVQNPGAFPLKITPSREKRSYLTERSIPFYYTGIDDMADRWSLEGSWNYEMARRCLFEGSVLAYENNYEDQAGEDIPDSAVTKPLSYDRDRYDFYRIEGCLGKTGNEVMDELKLKIENYNLPFDLVAVRVNSATDPLTPASIDYATGFHDLHEDYITFRYQTINFLKNGFYLWDLFKRFEEEARSTDETYESQMPEMTKAIVEGVDDRLKNYLCQNLPPCLLDFVENFEELKNGYSDAIQYAIDQFVENADHEDIADWVYEVEKESGLDMLQELIALATRILYQVLDPFFFNPLHRIYYAFRRREYYYSLQLNKNRHTFSQYLGRHPGLEHMAGVPSGGTFVLLYGDTDGESPQVAGDFALPYRCCGEDHASIPICDDEEAREQIQVHPFARPDIGFTHVNEAIVIDLTLNDHELYDRENEYCDERDTVSNLTVADVNPIENEAEVEILEDERNVRFTPPPDFQGILRFEYTIEKVSNGLADTGTVTILVTEFCIKMGNHEFVVRGGVEESVTLPEEYVELGYRFADPVYDENILKVEIDEDTLRFEVLEDLEESYTFRYRAVSQDETHDGCGRITLTPAEVTYSFQIITQPSLTVAGSAIAGPPEIRVIDTFSNPVGGVEVRVRELDGYVFDEGATTASTGEDGRAAFPDLVIHAAGSYNLVYFSDEIETEAVSSSFAVNCLGLQDFTFEVRTPGQQFQAELPPELLELGYEFTDTDHDGQLVAVTVNPDLLDITSRVVPSQPYTFNYNAHADGGPDGCGTITLMPGGADSIDIVSQPIGSVAGSAIGGPPQVRVTDAQGEPVGGVRIEVSEQGGYAFDAGTVTQSTGGDGVAAFTDLVIHEIGNYQLVFRSTEMQAEVVSNTFRVRCLTLQDYTFPVTQPGQKFQAVMRPEFQELGYVFNSTNNKSGGVLVDVQPNVLEITTLDTLDATVTFEYSAVADGEPVGCGSVALILDPGGRLDLTDFTGTVSMTEVEPMLKARNIDISGMESEEAVLNEMTDSIKNQPLTQEDLDALSTDTVNKLGEFFKVSNPESNQQELLNEFNKFMSGQ